MKGIIEFDLREEREEFDMALRASVFFRALDMSRAIILELLARDDLNSEIREELDKIWRIVNEGLGED